MLRYKFKSIYVYINKKVIDRTYMDILLANWVIIRTFHIKYIVSTLFSSINHFLKLSQLFWAFWFEKVSLVGSFLKKKLRNIGWAIVLMLDGNVLCRHKLKQVFFEKENRLLWSNQIHWTDQISEIAPYVRTYFWVTI